MTYMLFRKTFVGSSMYYEHICSNPDIKVIKDRIIGQAMGGCPIDNLIIVNSIPFELKCAVKLIDGVAEEKICSNCEYFTLVGTQACRGCRDRNMFKPKSTKSDNRNDDWNKPMEEPE